MSSEDAFMGILPHQLYGPIGAGGQPQRSRFRFVIPITCIGKLEIESGRMVLVLCQSVCHLRRGSRFRKPAPLVCPPVRQVPQGS